MTISADDFHRLFENVEEYLAAPEEDRINLLSEIETQFGLHFAALAKSSREKGRNCLTHKVVLIHGIRDNGDWFPVIQSELDGVDLIEVEAAGYGYFHVKKFVTPARRKEAYQKVVRALSNAGGHLCAVSVICHSFGTYCVTKALLEHQHIRVFRLVLCGGIVHPDFDWTRLGSPIPKGRIYNDCGNQDVWPIAARWIFREFGESGRYGFSRSPVIDRFHDVGHGGFFTADFVRGFWLPFLRSGQKVDSGVGFVKPKLWQRALARRIL